MKPSTFEYGCPPTLDDAIGLLGKNSDSALIAGGQSLVPLLNLRLAPFDYIVDIGRIAELRETRDLGDRVFVGAGLTHAMFEDGIAPDPGNGLMRKAAGNIAYRAVRCHGTIGGSVAMADPAADWPAVLLALGALAICRGPQGERRVAMDELLVGTYETSLRPGEIIAGFEIFKLPASARTSYVKFNKKVGAFATSLAVVVHDVANVTTRVVIAGAGPRASLLHATAAALATGAGTDACIARELDALMPEPDAYSCHLHQTTLGRAIGEVSGA
ncbi:MAG: carbon monoxide dehydrogenase [Hyphomicrobiales bacterium]|nr:carbon monoxide dehydrogenase [Hyphomicrobiales bacterium]